MLSFYSLFRRKGPPSFKLREIPHQCQYGLKKDQHTNTKSVVCFSASLKLTSLPDDALTSILLFLCTWCNCSCHRNQVLYFSCIFSNTRKLYGDGTVHALCTLSLVCRRFTQPIVQYNNLSIPEEAARQICCSMNSCKKQYKCWREQLLFLDPKVSGTNNLASLSAD